MRKTSNFLKLVLVAFFCMSTTALHANENGENVVYIGSGPVKNNDTSTSSDKKPITLGYLRQSRNSDNIWGIDISAEGSMLDSTWGQTQAVKQATSFNLLIGKNFTRNENSRFDAAFLIGVREKTSECPKSYLGYQCYANSTPDTKYGFNYGLVMTWTYKSLMLGGRVTGESTQALIGLRF
jgi:hypothetical protein